MEHKNLRKTPKIGRDWMILKLTGLKRKKQEESGRNRKKQKETGRTERNRKKEKETERNSKKQ